MRCRFDGSPVTDIVADLGLTPLANALSASREAAEDAPRYPLRVLFSPSSFLLQTDADINPRVIFGDSYPYYSSTSRDWSDHAQRFAVTTARELCLSPRSRIVEIGSNDGYLLRHFLDLGIPALGVEPAGGVAAAAKAKGVETLCGFFSAAAANEIRSTFGRCDLIVANNVLAHIPDLRGTVDGMAILLAERGTISIEVPHVLELVRQLAVDTIYHEHFFYFSLTALNQVLTAAGLTIVRAERLETFGGSLRIYARHANYGEPDESVSSLLAMEEKVGMHERHFYSALAEGTRTVRSSFDALFAERERLGGPIGGYPASAKASTLLNIAGVGCSEVYALGDNAPAKIGKFVAGVAIPVTTKETLLEARPSLVVVFSPNILRELARDLEPMKGWGGRLVTLLPRFRIWEWEEL